MSIKELHPSKLVFLKFRLLNKMLIALFFFSLSILIPESNYQIIYLAICSIFSLITIYSNVVTFRKEKYFFYDDKIVVKTGGIFSDNETELSLKNITHVEMCLPFVTNTLFKTGDIIIKSAGCTNSKIYLKNILDSNEYFELIKELMKKNGFKLDTTKLIQKEKPSKIGVFFESLKSVKSLPYYLIVIGLFVTSLQEKTDLRETINFYITIISFIFLSVIVIKILLRFLDLSLRVYKVYSDVITYSEGFLTKNYSFIPTQNLSDSSITQSFVDKIFSFYNIAISCQGAGQEIIFTNMKNGVMFQKNLERIIRIQAKIPITSNCIESDNSKITTDFIPKIIKLDTSFTAKFKMKFFRTLFGNPLVLIPYIPFWFIPLFATKEDVYFFLFPTALILMIGFLISKFINIRCTTYSIKPNSVEKTYNFFTKKTAEFTCDKITQIIVKKNIIDRIFNTISIQFMSIGSIDPITFKNIKNTNETISILKKIGIQNQNITYSPKIKFSIFNIYKKNLLKSVLYTLIFVANCISINESKEANIFLGINIAFIISLILYKYRFYKNIKFNFYTDYLYFKKGILNMKEHYTLFHNIKDITTVKYPLSSSGDLLFNIAGESTNQETLNSPFTSNTMTVPYVENIVDQNTLLDIVLINKPDKREILDIEENLKDYVQKPILKVKEHILSNLFSHLLFSIIIFPLFPLLVVTIPAIIWNTLVKSYTIEPHRIVYKSGIFYKKHKSVVFEKLDFINLKQTFVGKLFRTGNITISTAGSRYPEITIKNIKEYDNMYTNLKNKYNAN